MNIQQINVEDIIPYWRNPRKNDETVPALVKSVEKYGFKVPLILDNKNVIISGHTRFRAIVELGWKNVPCIKVDFTDEKAKELRLLDNRIHDLTNWNFVKLEREMEAMLRFNDTLDFFDGTLDKILEYKKKESDVDLQIENGEMEIRKEDILVLCPVCMEITKVEH